MEPALRAADLGWIPPFPLGFCPGSSHTSDLNIGMPVYTLPGAWLRVSTMTGWPDVSSKYKIIMIALKGAIQNFFTPHYSVCLQIIH